MRWRNPDDRQLLHLIERVAKLEARANEKRGLLGWIAKWGVLIGLIATSLSIFGGALNISTSLQKLHPKANTKAFHVEDTIIHRTFDPETRQLTYKVHFIITNNGDADDLIIVESTLYVPELQERDKSHSFGGNFEIVDASGRKLSRPFVLAKGSSLDLNCSTTFSYAVHDASVFQRDGERRLRLVFDNGTKDRPLLEFCYDEIYTPDTHQFYGQTCTQPHQ